jgi:HPt (histidine-containing phosphotransfer) domain-containing protein
MRMATGYKVGEINSVNYYRLLQETEKEVEDIKHMDKKVEVIDKMVNAYFEQPEKTLKEVFGEYTEDLTEEETKKFFDNLKAIIN